MSSFNVLSPTLAPRRLAASYRTLLSNAGRDDSPRQQGRALDMSSSSLKGATQACLDAHDIKRRKLEAENNPSGAADGEATEDGADTPLDTLSAAEYSDTENKTDNPDGLNIAAPLAPLVRFRSLASDPNQSSIVPMSSNAPRMLIADDSYTIRRFLQRTFEQRGYSVDVATNGWHAFAQMQTHLYDFVFLDIEMPGMNGYRCAQALRKWEERVEREQRQFICALTSHSKPAERELGLGIGMDLFESKPARPKRLLDIVEHALKAAKGDAAATAAIAAAATAMACGAIQIKGESTGQSKDGYDVGVVAEFGSDTIAELAVLRPDGAAQDGDHASPFEWTRVRVEVKTGSGYQCETVDDKVAVKKVSRRRLRKATERQPIMIDPGAVVDVAVQGAFKPATVITRESKSGGTYTLSIEGLEGHVTVPRSHILATPVERTDIKAAPAAPAPAAEAEAPAEAAPAPVEAPAVAPMTAEA